MPTFLRGAKPTPNHVLAASTPYRVLAAPLPQFGVVPPKLDIWGNDQYGDCVSAEEAFAKAWWSTYCGLTETFATTAEVVAFARAHGWLNGAYLTEVMDAMIAEGMKIGGKAYMDGKYGSVDYSNELVLQSALDATDGTGGPVKIGIDANALPQGAGNVQGWYALKKGNYPNTDHCVALAGYGSADYLYGLLKVARPAALAASTPGYLLYTWKTIGFVTHDWLMGTTTEAWVRNPTTPGQAPAPVPVPPPTPPDPTPPGPTPTPTPTPTAAFHIAISANCTPPHGMAGTYTITPAAVPVPKELAGLGTPVWVLILMQWLGARALPIVLADLAAGKTWGQVATDLVVALLGGQANVTPRKVRGVLSLAQWEAGK